MNSKAELRKHYRAVRDAIPEKDRKKHAYTIERLVLSNDRVQRADSVFAYIGTGSEVATDMLIIGLRVVGKTVVVPLVTDEPGMMRTVAIDSLKPCIPNRFGIPEPAHHRPFRETPDVTLVPGLAFTRAGARLGQGGGYYDRYLAQHPATYKIGICFNEQLGDVLPTSEHDICMDEVVTA
ncbi:MAG: 5-formyltetrahydrofolate cyclo-ligase [Planctomycetota bacterium]